jgi:hypothetical protein
MHRYSLKPQSPALVEPSSNPLKTSDSEPVTALSSELAFIVIEENPSANTNLKNEQDAGATSVSAEPSLIEVYWEEPIDQDPANPMNWPSSRKWMNIGVLSSITFLTCVPTFPIQATPFRYT